MTRRHKLLLIAVFLTYACLTFRHLSTAAPWDDEAQVGIIARNLLNTGRLTGWDGVNLYGYRNGSLLTSTFFYNNPPLDSIIAAGSFRLLGVNALALRLPFAICGLISLGVFLAICRRLMPGNPAACVYAIAAFGLNLQFLLDSRTGRYWTVSILCQLLVYLFAERYMQEHRIRDAAAVAIAAIVAFYASYLLCLATLVSVLAAVAIFERKSWRSSDWCVLGGVAAIFLASTMPFALAHKIWIRPDSIPTRLTWVQQHGRLIWWHVRDINEIGGLPWMMALLLILLYPRIRRDAPQIAAAACEWAVLVFSTAIVIGLLSPEWADMPGLADIHYTAGTLPFECGLAGLAIAAVHINSKPLAICLLGLASCTDALCLTPLPSTIIPFPRQFTLTTPRLAGEEMHPYPTANGEAARIIESEAGPGDMVMVAPSVVTYPLMFAVGDKVRFCCQLDQHLPYSPKTLFAPGLPEYLREASPDWIVFFGSNQLAAARVAEIIRRYSKPHVDVVTGKLVVRTFTIQPVLVYSDMLQRTDNWAMHSFGPVLAFDPNKFGLFIIHASPPTSAAGASGNYTAAGSSPHARAR